jgi:hypothetical protein
LDRFKFFVSALPSAIRASHQASHQVQPEFISSAATPIRPPVRQASHQPSQSGLPSASPPAQRARMPHARGEVVGGNPQTPQAVELRLVCGLERSLHPVSACAAASDASARAQTAGLLGCVALRRLPARHCRRQRRFLRLLCSLALAPHAAAVAGMLQLCWGVGRGKDQGKPVVPTLGLGTGNLKQGHPNRLARTTSHRSPGPDRGARSSPPSDPSPKPIRADVPARFTSTSFLP